MSEQKYRVIIAIDTITVGAGAPSPLLGKGEVEEVRAYCEKHGLLMTAFAVDGEGKALNQYA